MNRTFLLLVCVLASTSTLANPAQPKRPPPCQPQSPDRIQWPNGTLLWGTKRQSAGDEMSTVLASVDLDRARLKGGTVKQLRLEKGLLVAPALGREALVGAVLQGTSSDSQPVEVALCSAEPDAGDPAMVRYRIELWDEESATWKNPCIATLRVPTPRAMAVQGVWARNGARMEVPGKFTFACENGAIAKCMDWGYKPWEVKDGHSLAELHQACTRMARADYCGDGRSLTNEETPIDVYDGLGVLTRTKVASAGWDPQRASFEAEWTPEGASCLARTRDGQPVERVLAECADRFEVASKELGDGDHCAVRRKQARASTALLRNRSYGEAAPAPK